MYFDVQVHVWRNCNTGSHIGDDKRLIIIIATRMERQIHLLYLFSRRPSYTVIAMQLKCTAG